MPQAGNSTCCMFQALFCVLWKMAGFGTRASDVHVTCTPFNGCYPYQYDSNATRNWRDNYNYRLGIGWSGVTVRVRHRTPWVPGLNPALSRCRLSVFTFSQEGAPCLPDLDFLRTNDVWSCTDKLIECLWKCFSTQSRWILFRFRSQFDQVKGQNQSSSVHVYNDKRTE